MAYFFIAVAIPLAAITLQVMTGGHSSTIQRLQISRQIALRSDNLELTTDISSVRFYRFRRHVQVHRDVFAGDALLNQTGNPRFGHRQGGVDLEVHG